MGPKNKAWVLNTSPHRDHISVDVVRSRHIWISIVQHYSIKINCNRQYQYINSIITIYSSMPLNICILVRCLVKIIIKPYVCFVAKFGQKSEIAGIVLTLYFDGALSILKGVRTIRILCCNIRTEIRDCRHYSHPIFWMSVVDIKRCMPRATHVVHFWGKGSPRRYQDKSQPKRFRSKKKISFELIKSLCWTSIF